MEQEPLYDRLGGRDGVRKLTEQVLENHYANPMVGTRFQHANMSRDELISSATEFFCTGLSGVATYQGRDMPTAHAGMNISAAEFVAVLDDVLSAMRKLGHGELEQAEVLKIMYDMKPDVVAQ